MSDENKTTASPEDFRLHIHQEELTDITLQVPDKAMRSLRRVAERRELPIEAVMKFYISKGLREDLADLLAGDVIEKTEQVLSKHLKSKKEVSDIIHEIKNDLAA